MLHFYISIVDIGAFPVSNLIYNCRLSENS